MGMPMLASSFALWCFRLFSDLPPNSELLPRVFPAPLPCESNPLLLLTRACCFGRKRGWNCYLEIIRTTFSPSVCRERLMRASRLPSLPVLRHASL